MLNRLLLLTGAAAAAALTAPRIGRTSAVPSTVWDSVYTAEQVTRGDSLYGAGCIKCHGAALTGGDDGNALTGDSFMDNWQGMTLDQLYDRIRKSMPPDNPNSIPREQVPDLIAFILSKNGFPAGTTPLSEDTEKLKDIRFEKTKP